MNRDFFFPNKIRSPQLQTSVEDLDITRGLSDVKVPYAPDFGNFIFD